MSVTSHRKKLFAGAVTGLVALGAGTVWGATAARKDEPWVGGGPTTYAAESTSQPSGQDASTAVKQTIAGLDSSLLTKVYVAKAPAGEKPGQWFYAQLALPPDGEKSLSVWEADLAQGAVAERMASGPQNLAGVISGSSVDVVKEDGTVSTAPGGAGDIAAGQVFASQDRGDTDAEIAQGVDRVLATWGLTPDEVRVLRPLGPAVIVRATAATPDLLHGQFDQLRTALLGDPVNWEGLYLQIDLPDGQLLVRNSVAFRSGAGRLTVDPRFDDMVGAAHG